MSAETKPAPWGVSWDSDGGYDCTSAAYRVTDANGLDVVTVDVRDFIGRNPDYEELHAPNGEAEKVARLIAAAPEMLALLKTHAAFFAGLERTMMGAGAPESAAGVAVAAREARALIAEVETRDSVLPTAAVVPPAPESNGKP